MGNRPDKHTREEYAKRLEHSIHHYEDLVVFIPALRLLLPHPDLGFLPFSLIRHVII